MASFLPRPFLSSLLSVDNSFLLSYKSCNIVVIDDEITGREAGLLLELSDDLVKVRVLDVITGSEPWHHRVLDSHLHLHRGRARSTRRQTQNKEGEAPWREKVYSHR
jgi:hypothetical protein